MGRLASMAVTGVVAVALAGCGEDIDTTPKRIDGSSSYEFESDDIERARDAPGAVKEYCADAVSEAQRLGCESHVDESDVP